MLPIGGAACGGPLLIGGVDGAFFGGAGDGDGEAAFGVDKDMALLALGGGGVGVAGVESGPA